MNWGGPGPCSSILLLITVVRENTKRNWRNKAFLSPFSHWWHFDWGAGPCLPPVYVYGALAIIARSWLFCYDMLGYCMTKTCLFFFTLNAISCFILSRDVEAEAMEAVKFLWKHFNERDQKQKRIRKQVILFRAASKSKKLQRWGSGSEFGSIKPQKELEVEALKIWLLPYPWFTPFNQIRWNFHTRLAMPISFHFARRFENYILKLFFNKNIIF